MSFFWRIFLSAWAIVLITILVTPWAASWLPNHDSSSNGDDTGFHEQMVTLIASELRGYLAEDPATAGQLLTKEHVLDFPPMLAIYVVDPEGNEVLGRPLPAAVADVDRMSQRAEGVLPAGSSRVHVRTDGLGGYKVIGYEGYFPVSNVLIRPGGRGLLLALMLVVSAAVSVMLARFIVLPVQKLRMAGQKVADGDLSVRVAPSVGSRTDDIARLAHDFDVMTGRVNALLQSKQRLMRDVSHELRSPLARLQALLSISRQTADAGGMERIVRMERELERLDELIGEILAYTRMETQEGITPRPTDIVDLVQNIVDDASLEGQTAGKEIRLQGPQRCLLDLDSGLIQSAIENVIRNAMKYTADGTTVDVTIVEEPGRLRVVIDDYGPGVPPDAIDKIFEPFFRVDESRNTTTGSGGIGLAIAERSVRLHGGTMMASNREAGGLRVEMVLPAGHDPRN
jgi:two-component system sensor histidine kinase CpxA